VKLFVCICRSKMAAPYALLIFLELRRVFTLFCMTKKYFP
jgi:hypothetical protein